MVFSFYKLFLEKVSSNPKKLITDDVISSKMKGCYIQARKLFFSQMFCLKLYHSHAYLNVSEQILNDYF